MYTSGRSTTKALMAVLLSIFSLPLISNAQLNVTNTLTPQDLVQNVLAGPGVQISNVTYNGVLNPGTPQLGSGEFVSVNSNLGIPSGVVLSSGDATVCGQPAANFSSNTNLTISDPDLVAISGGTINDAAVLEFDFVPMGDSLKFNFVFGSEEYPEFVCSFNDAFGFFLSGPGIAGPYQNGAENIALIPGTTIPVTINNVNNGLNNDPNAPGCPATNPQYYVNNATGTTVIFDGFTTVLQARAAVQCGQTYHIKLAVGDALDNAYDSGVFLEAGSFTSNAVQVEVSGAVSSDSSIVEGCSSAFISIIRPDTAGIDTVSFDIGGNATNGSDYVLINDTVIFQSGVDTIDIAIIPIDDGIADGPDTLIITAYTITPCGDTIVDIGVIYIVDSIPFAVNAPDIDITCPTDSVTISATSLGDPQDYSFLWSNGATDSVITVPFTGAATDTLFVAVTDTCGNSTTLDTVVITNSIAPPPQVVASNDTTVSCANQLINMSATGSFGQPPYSYSWSTGQNGQSVSYNLPNTEWIIVTITDNCGITATDSLLGTVAPTPPTITLTQDTTVLCAGDDVILDVSASNGTPNYVYTWSTGSNANQILVNPTTTTTYVVGVTDVCNPNPVFDSVTVTVPVYGPIDGGLLDYSPTCPGDAVTVLSNATGGAGGYTYLWNNGESTSSIGVNPTTTTTYTVTITDACGVVATDQSTVNVPIYDPLVAAGNPGQLICSGNSTAVTVVVNGGAGGNSYSWGGPGGITASGASATVTPTSTPSIYTVDVTDQCGNTVQATTMVETEACQVYIPNVMSPNGDGMNDYFVIRNVEKFPGNNLKIYNRWGKLVLDQDDYNNDWDAKDYSDGTYFYILTLPERDSMSGHVTVVRGE